MIRPLSCRGLMPDQRALCLVGRNRGGLRIGRWRGRGGGRRWCGWWRRGWRVGRIAACCRLDAGTGDVHRRPDCLGANIHRGGRHCHRGIRYGKHRTSRKQPRQQQCRQQRRVTARRHAGCPGWRRAQRHNSKPATIIGMLSHWPMEKLSASRPRKSSGSRANSAVKRNTP